MYKRQLQRAKFLVDDKNIHFMFLRACVLMPYVVVDTDSVVGVR